MAKAGLQSIALALAALSAPALAEVEDGVEAWSHGDYAKAVAEWRRPAAKGDADAQFNLAQAYKLGKGVPADLERAEALYLAAARQGHLQAADTYGLLLFRSGRREASIPWLTAAAERGEPRAQYLLGIGHFNGDFVPRDAIRAYALMTRAAAGGLVPARATLATMDEALPIDIRQRGVALAGELEMQANQARAAQLAALDLREGGAQPGKSMATVAAAGASERQAPQAVTAGADFAGPVEIPFRREVPASPPRFAAKTEPAKPAATSAAAAGQWRVQLGAFGVPGNAQAMWKATGTKGALAGKQPFYVAAGKLTKLQAGPFGSRAEAQAACDRLFGQACIPVGP